MMHWLIGWDLTTMGLKRSLKRIEKIYPKEKRVVPLGINIGKGRKTPIDKAHDDYVSCLRKCYKQADYITINISSPNTPNLRELHQGDFNCTISPKFNGKRGGIVQNYLIRILFHLLLKISPDESYKSLENIVADAKEIGFSGVIATNTSVTV